VELERVQTEKRRLRARTRRATQERDPSYVQARGHLLDLPEISQAQTIALYAAIDGEPPAEDLLAELCLLGKRVVFPRIEEGEIVLLEVRAISDLVPGCCGIREPHPGCVAVPPEEIDVFVVPGVLFDRHGYRLGRGGGHYDRLLLNAREDAALVGLCSAHHLRAERLPVAPWEVAMDILVTEREVLRLPAECRDIGSPAR